MSTISKKDFGCLSDGRPVFLYTLTNANGTALSICTYGGHVQALHTKGADGTDVDVVLGYDDVETYVNEDKYIGALIGRCGNRIARGRLHIGGKEYQLECNNGRNHLHGGTLTGFNKKLWQAEESAEGLKLELDTAKLQYGTPFFEILYPEKR